MFFTEDLQIGKSGSLGIVCFGRLMATLGPKNKRITRKAITNLEIPHTCELIGQPAEPMALRLSGHLLVGVTRAYKQSFEIFYSDVRNFDSALRRSVTVTLGGESASTSRSSDALDLPNGGRGRYDHITFAEAGEAFALDLPGGLEFGAIDWNRPINEQRQRRGTSKLSSLNTHSSHSTYEGGMLLDYDSDDDSRRSEDESDVGRGRKRNSSMATIDTINKRPRLPTREPDVMDFNPIELDILGDPLLEDISDDPMQAPMDDLNAEPPSPGKEREGSHDSADPSLGGRVATPVGVGKRRSDSSSHRDQSQEAGDNAKTTAKAVKRVRVDKELEAVNDNVSYEQMITGQRRDRRSKLTEKLNRSQATSLVDRAGLFVQFMDTAMHEFFGHVAEPPKPRWKVAPQLNDDAEYAHPTDASDFHLEMAGVDLLTAEENDVFDTDLPQQAPDSALSQSADGAFGYPQYTPPSYSTDAHRILTETPEQPRRQSQRLPWEDALELDIDGLDSHLDLPQDESPSKRRFSIVTSLEQRIRSNVSTPDPDVNRTGERARRSRSRSGSVLSMLPADDSLLSLDVDDLLQDEPTKAGPFAPVLLASLEQQCRSFFTYVEQRMIQHKTTDIELEEIVAVGSDKRVAAAAFYNCLTLATKGILKIQQDTHFGPISVRINADDGANATASGPGGSESGHQASPADAGEA